MRDAAMANEREEVTLRGLARWLVLAFLILAGLGLYFAVGRNAPSVVQAPSVEVH
jgi:hypothetical protein